MCNTEVEDEIHFLLICDAYAEPRCNLYHKASTFDHAFPEFDVFEKFLFLMSNLESVPLLICFCQIFFLCLFVIKLLSIPFLLPFMCVYGNRCVLIQLHVYGYQCSYHWIITKYFIISTQSYKL